MVSFWKFDESALCFADFPAEKENNPRYYALLAVQTGAGIPEFGNQFAECREIAAWRGLERLDRRSWYVIKKNFNRESCDNDFELAFSWIVFVKNKPCHFQMQLYNDSFMFLL